MTGNRKRAAQILISLISLGLASGAYALDKPALIEKNADAEAPTVNLSVPPLAQVAQEYQVNPDDISWTKYWNLLKEVLATPLFAQCEAGAFLQANPSLTGFHVKVMDLPPFGRIWNFPSVLHSHSVLFQSRAGRVFVLPLPQGVSLKEARFVGGYVRPAAPVPSPAPRGKAKAAPRPAAKPAAGGEHADNGQRFLVLIGADRQVGTLWFRGFKMDGGALFEAPELFASLPAFFSQNVTGRAGFSNNDIILTVLPPAPKEPPKESLMPGEKPRPQVQPVGYKVMLKYQAGKYLLSGKMPDDGPNAIALSFSQALAAGKSELAKAWLCDPKLISIAKYIGIIGRTSPPMRLVPMSGSTGARYRLITSGKDDLIIEVGRILQPGRLKGQVAIKALFVAPPDALAQNITGTIVMPQEKPPATEASRDPSKDPKDKNGKAH